MSTVSKYASLVRFSHTIFALPFALTGYVYALTSTGTPFEWLLLVKILLCMVFARNTAMGFNRWADRRIDAANPRTAKREIPSGKIKASSALWFTVVNGIAFLVVAAFINRPTLVLAPFALFILIGYSYTKRFTAWSHMILGTALGIAPTGAYVAVTGTIGIIPILLSGVVIAWTAAFDILYSMQDAEFDRQNGLRSVPARFSPRASVAISILLDLVAVYGIMVIGMWMRAGILYWTGTWLFIILIVIQHILYRPATIDRIGKSFGLVNGLASVIYAIFTILDMVL